MALTKYSAILYALYPLIGGFPLWIIFVYVYEWTPTGFQKTDEVEEQTSVYKQNGKRFKALTNGGADGGGSVANHRPGIQFHGYI